MSFLTCIWYFLVLPGMLWKKMKERQLAVLCEWTWKCGQERKRRRVCDDKWDKKQEDEWVKMSLRKLKMWERGSFITLFPLRFLSLSIPLTEKKKILEREDEEERWTACFTQMYIFVLNSMQNMEREREQRRDLLTIRFLHLSSPFSCLSLLSFF